MRDYNFRRDAKRREQRRRKHIASLGWWPSVPANKGGYYTEASRDKKKGFYKNQSNRRIRRNAIGFKSAADHRKLYDYWWSWF